MSFHHRLNDDVQERNRRLELLNAAANGDAHAQRMLWIEYRARVCSPAERDERERQQLVP